MNNNFSHPTWKQLGDKQDEIDSLHKENALKLKQILDLEEILYNTRKKEFDLDCGACWCNGYVNPDKHLDFCIKARQATEPFWKK